MPHIIVDDEQARIISGSSESIAIHDSHGRHLGYVTPGLSAEDQKSIAIAKRRLASSKPRYTTKQVLEYLHSFDRADFSEMPPDGVSSMNDNSALV